MAKNKKIFFTELLEKELSEIHSKKNEAIRMCQYEESSRLKDRELEIMDKLEIVIEFNCFKCLKNTCSEANMKIKGRMIKTSISDTKMDLSVQKMLNANFYIKHRTSWDDDTEVWICNECLEKEQKHYIGLHKKAHHFEKNQNKSIVGNTVCLNPDDKEMKRVYRLIEPTRNSYRTFDGKYHRHCSKCPFAEGCITCTLP